MNRVRCVSKRVRKINPYDLEQVGRETRKVKVKRSFVQKDLYDLSSRVIKETFCE